MESASFTIKIVYEDDFVVVVNKPSCIHSVTLGKGRKNTIADFLISNFPNIELASLKPQDGGLVNRLDFETTGLLLAAKTRESWRLHYALHKNGKIHKKYLALVEGKFPDRLTLENFIGSKSRRGRKVYTFSQGGARRLQAVSLMSRFAYNPLTDTSLIEISGSIFRRHQIRAHLASVGHPLLGDVLYGSKRNTSELKIKTCVDSNQLFPFYLHSHKLSYNCPFSLKIVEFTARPPDVLAQFAE